MKLREKQLSYSSEWLQEDWFYIVSCILPEELFTSAGEQVFFNRALVAIMLRIVESRQEEKNIMVTLVMNLLSKIVFEEFAI